MEGHCSTGQSPQWAVVPMEEEEEDMTNHTTYSVVDGRSGFRNPASMRFSDCTGGPPCLLYNGCRFSLSMVKRPESGFDHPTSSSVGFEYNHTFTVT